MIGSRKVLAAFLAVMISFCAVVAVSAVGSDELSITATSVGEYELEVKLENICDYYLGNVDIKIEGTGSDGIEIEAYGLSGGSSSDADTIRAIAPGEAVAVTATISGGEKTTAEKASDAPASGNDSSDGGIPSYFLWIALGVAVVAAVVVAAIVIKKKKNVANIAKDISTVIIIAVLLVSLVSANASTVYAASDTLKQAVDGTATETINIAGKGDISVTVEYTVVPHAVTEPLKIPSPSENDADANSKNVNKRRIVEDAGPLTEQNIYIGKNDFMFFGQAIDDYTGASIMTDIQLKKISDMMTNRDKWAKDNGIKLYLVIAPNKSTVYPDYVPSKVSAASKTNADYVVEYLEANSTVEVIDLRDPLIAARAEYGDTLFYKYDTHWNNNGGFVGYTEIMRRINEDVGGAYTLVKSDFDIAEYETYMKDMTYYLGYYSDYTDYGPVYTLKSGMTATIGVTENDGYWGQFKYCARWKDGYSDALKYVAYENKYNTDAPSVYVYRDSFAVSLIHFLKDSFHNSVFDWSYEFSRSEVLESGADVVIMEVVEKQLSEFMSTRTFSN